MSWYFDLIPDSASTAIWAMVVASLLPFVFAMLSKLIGGFKISDNAHPREAIANMTGMAARANAAQQNSFETLPIFLTSVIVAMLFFVPQSVVNNLAIMYVILRIAYGVAYLINLPTLRSIIWALSMVCCFMIFYLAIRLSY